MCGLRIVKKILWQKGENVLWLNAIKVLSRESDWEWDLHIHDSCGSLRSFETWLVENRRVHIFLMSNVIIFSPDTTKTFNKIVYYLNSCV